MIFYAKFYLRPSKSNPQIHEVQVRKSYFVSPESIEWLENFFSAKTVYSNITVGGQPNLLPIFDSM